MSLSNGSILCCLCCLRQGAIRWRGYPVDHLWLQHLMLPPERRHEMARLQEWRHALARLQMIGDFLAVSSRSGSGGIRCSSIVDNQVTVKSQKVRKFV